LKPYRLSFSKSVIAKADEIVFGKTRSDLEDLAFLKRPQGKPFGRSKCLRKLKPVDSENTPLLPQRVKSGSVSGFALLTSSVRNHARSAFKRFSHPLPFAYPPQREVKEWR
jgi:hypothetical protein